MSWSDYYSSIYNIMLIFIYIRCFVVSCFYSINGLFLLISCRSVIVFSSMLRINGK